MFSLKDGEPIALLNKKSLDNKKKIVYSNDSLNGEFNKIELKNDAYFSLIPSKPRFSYFIAGPSGVGKSTIAADLTTKFNKMYPESEILMFSRCKIEDDNAYKELKNFVKQIDYSKLVSGNIEYDRENMLFIFDDVTSISDDQERQNVYKLIIDILETGRKKNINIIMTSHLINNNDRKLNRIIMNEVSNIIYFPCSGVTNAITYFLTKYLGKTNKEANKLVNIKSRWVLIHITHPQFYICENKISIL